NCARHGVAHPFLLLAKNIGTGDSGGNWQGSPVRSAARHLEVSPMYARQPAPLRVLVADDCADTRKSMRMLLKVWGHECRVAADGEEAVRLATDYRPDVVRSEER